jgi:hypothetical protein
MDWVTKQKALRVGDLLLNIAFGSTLTRRKMLHVNFKRRGSSHI